MLLNKHNYIFIHVTECVCVVRVCISLLIKQRTKKSLTHTHIHTQAHKYMNEDITYE